jgi:hypothetical protein
LADVSPRHLAADTPPRHFTPPLLFSYAAFAADFRRRQLAFAAPPPLRRFIIIEIYREK